MGFPIRTNIFNSGSPSQRYFARFPIQVAILFNPSDVRFTEYLKSEFAGLDIKTGDNLAFFAVLDPPEDWLQDRSNSRWWHIYQESAGSLSFTVDDRVLMREISRLFGMQWHSLPAIVVSTNLWQVEYVSCPTSSEHLEIQLNELSRLPDRYGIPNIGHIVSTLEAICGDRVDYSPPNELAYQRLSSFYRILNTVDQIQNSDTRDYRYELGRQLDAVESSINSLRRNYRSQQLEEFEPTDIGVMDAVIEDAAGRLVAPASVAARVLRDLNDSVELQGLLNDESLVMIKTSIRVGFLLEGLAENSLGGLGPLGRRRPRGGYGKSRRGQNVATLRPKDIPMIDIDFTPSAQGAWKAFELEINLSVVQAARSARDIIMPYYFTLYDSTKSKAEGIVETGNRRGRKFTVDINQKDWEEPYRSSGRHRFITLGDALHLVIAMTSSSNEKLDYVIKKAIGKSLPNKVLTAWDQIKKIRNKGSHVSPLEQEDYERVLELALSPENLRPLLEIKDAILQGRT